MNEYSCKIALRAAELEQKAIKLAKLTKKEKKGESISLLNSFIDLQMMNQKAMAAALDIPRPRMLQMHTWQPILPASTL